MIRVILGKKGTGKTKKLLDSIELAAKDEKGSVVFINRGTRHIYDVRHDVRLIDTSEFELCDFSAFLGFISGVISQDFDIAHIFVDSVTKIVADDITKLGAFLDDLNKLGGKFNTKFTLTISLDPSEVDDSVKKYVKD